MAAKKKRKCKYGKRVKGKCPTKKARGLRRAARTSPPPRSPSGRSVEYGYWDGPHRVNPGIYATTLEEGFEKLKKHAAKRGITLRRGEASFYACPYGCGPSEA